MPSFTLLSQPDLTFTSKLKPINLECIVPQSFEGQKGEVHSAHSYLKWHCGHHAPVDLHRSGAKGYALLIGEAIEEHSDNYLTARELYEKFTSDPNKASHGLSRMSGFFAWIIVLDDESIHCGCDPFGLFPIYYFHEKNTFGIATSLEAFHVVPEYNSSVEPIGLSRNLLENGCSGHQTIEKSGRRLNISESLSYNPVTGILNTTQHPFPGQYASKSVYDLEEATQLSIEASTKAVERHIQRPVQSCMLSGGLDSRHVLSLTKQLGQSPTATTFGPSHSDECILAKKIAKRLHLPYQRESFSFAPAEAVLDDELKLSSLGGGFNGMTYAWGNSPSIIGTRCLKGIYLDVTYSPYNTEDTHLPFGTFEFTQNSWLHSFGTLPEHLREIYHPRFRESIETAITEARKEWRSFSDDPYERQWHTIARYRARAHHGGILWKGAFHYWPVVPALDVPLTEAIRSIDGKLQSQRLLQKQTFIGISPELATIPLAVTASKPQNIVASKKYWYLHKRFNLQKKALRFLEKRFNYLDTTHDAKIESWRIARDRVLNNLDQVSEIFDSEKVKDLIHDLYPEGKKVKFNRKVYSQRLMVGGTVWLANRNMKASKQTDDKA